jgi:hypothetical protein
MAAELTKTVVDMCVSELEGPDVRLVQCLIRLVVPAPGPAVPLGGSRRRPL